MAQECGVGWHQRLLHHCVSGWAGFHGTAFSVERLPSVSKAQGSVYSTIQMNKEQ